MQKVYIQRYEGKTLICVGNGIVYGIEKGRRWFNGWWFLKWTGYLGIIIYYYLRWKTRKDFK